MFKKRILEADKVSDRDIFNYITQAMLKQGIKSQEQWYDEDNDIVEDGDTCQYFGYDLRSDTDIRCAVGFIMHPEVFTGYQNEMGVEIENSGINTTEPLEVVILSNENWEFTKESWVMLSIFQRVHDHCEPEDWKACFQNMSYLFDSSGKFCPNHLAKDAYGNNIQHDELYANEDTTWNSSAEVNHFVDFESLGISFKIPHHNNCIVNKISDVIKGESDGRDFNSCLDKKVMDEVNMLDAENQSTADVSAMNFLDITDAVRINKQKKELIPNGGE